MRIIQVLATLILLSGTTHANSEEITYSCQIVGYETVHDSFIIKPSKNEVYWVNENKRIPITKIDEGNIEFIGVRSVLRIGEKNFISNVETVFRINRVTGELYIGGNETNSKGNKCVLK